MKTLCKQLYAAAQFIHCMTMSGVKFGVTDVLNHMDTVNESK